MLATGWRIANIDMDDYDMRMRCVEFKTVVVLVAYRYAVRLYFLSPMSS